MTVTTEQNGPLREISVVGSVNIACAAELKTTLIEALSAGQSLKIHLENVAELDVCILQLLVAATRAWRQNGLDCMLMGPIKGELAASIADAGFEPFTVTCDAVLLSEA